MSQGAASHAAEEGRESPGRLLEGDGAWAAGVAVSAAGLYASTFSTHVAGGDAPESVAGISSLGILHAPGYPAYVLAGRLFTWLVPFGGMAFRVNLFSLVCAALAAAGVFLLARRVGAGRAGSAIGALAMASGTAFWFNAGFAKHYSFSALLITAASLLVVSWTQRGGWWYLAGAGGLIGLSTGSSWQLAALSIPGLAVLVLGRFRRLRVSELAAGVLSGLLVAGAVWGFVAVRARQHPAVNWGEATSASRLTDLVTMEDFGFGAGTLGRSSSPAGDTPASGERRRAPQKNVGAEDAGELPARIKASAILLSRELSVLTLAIAGVGLVISWRRGPRLYAAFLTVAFVVNIGGAALVVGARRPPAMEAVVGLGGFLVGALVVVAAWAGVGASAVVAFVAEDRGRVAHRAVAVVVAALVLIPSVIGHRPHADHRDPAFVDQYTGNVLSSLPPRAVLLVWGTERTFPLVYSQVVHGTRPDVTIVAADALSLPWYRDQAARRLGLPPLPVSQNVIEQARELGQRLRRDRPVFLDANAMRLLSTSLRYRPRGLVGEVVDGSLAQAVDSPEEAERLMNSYKTDGVYSHAGRLRFPHRRIVLSYQRAHVELGRAYAATGNSERALAQIEMARRVDPALDLSRPL
ncbi:MAG: DUF2723 domain-containing protein [Actinomycetota bacterium]|nr:DUF2723 domain-containing protein [Actinomycetota bacterium]